MDLFSHTFSTSPSRLGTKNKFKELMKKVNESSLHFERFSTNVFLFVLVKRNDYALYKRAPNLTEETLPDIWSLIKLFHRHVGTSPSFWSVPSPALSEWGLFLHHQVSDSLCLYLDRPKTQWDWLWSVVVCPWNLIFCGKQMSNTIFPGSKLLKAAISASVH